MRLLPSEAVGRQFIHDTVKIALTKPNVSLRRSRDHESNRHQSLMDSKARTASAAPSDLECIGHPSILTSHSWDSLPASPSAE